MEATPPAKPAAPPTTGPDDAFEGLESRLDRVERKLGVRSLAGALAVVLALAAGIVGIVLALGAKDESATKDEVRSLQTQLEGVQRETAAAAEEDVASLSDRLDALEERLNTVAGSQRTAESELSVVQDDIDDLRDQISDLEAAPAPDSGSDGNDNP